MVTSYMLGEFITDYKLFRRDDFIILAALPDIDLLASGKSDEFDDFDFKLKENAIRLATGRETIKYALNGVKSHEGMYKPDLYNYTVLGLARFLKEAGFKEAGRLPQMLDPISSKTMNRSSENEQKRAMSLSEKEMGLLDGKRIRIVKEDSSSSISSWSGTGWYIETFADPSKRIEQENQILIAGYTQVHGG